MDVEEFLFIWTTGILGNLVNLIVFSQKNMVHPIKLIFWWLSMSDLLELAAYAWHQWCIGWTGELGINSVIAFRTSYIVVLLYLWSIYFLQVFHTITVGLNIALALWRYLAVAHPLVLVKIPCNNHSVKLTVILLYVLSFISYLPIWYMYQFIIDPGYFSSIYRCLLPEVSSTVLNTYVSDNDLVNLSIFFTSIVLRLGPFTILLTLSALLIIAVIKAHHNRRQLGIQDQHICQEQRKMTQINFTIMVIVLMFLITEIPMSMSGFVSLYYFWSCGKISNFVLGPLILLNSSYNVFCYLITSRNYRKTVKLLLKKCNWFSSSENVERQTYLELPLRQ